MLRIGLNLYNFKERGELVIVKWIDLPPLWLLGCLFLTWLSPSTSFLAKSFELGLGLLILAGGLVFFALLEFAKARTTVIPRQSPNALITSGVFRFSRNPIYLADVLVLMGFSLIWAKPLGLLLVPLFFVLLDRRFIRGEEQKLRAAFPDAFDDYVSMTRRWL